MDTKNTEYTKRNQERWNLLAEAHIKAAQAGTARYYDLDALRDGTASLFPVDLEELPDLTGKRILHLQCHFGMDTISLARMGTGAVGVDFSEKAISSAKMLAEELEVNASFVQCNLYDLPQIMAEDKESFDFVYTSHGVICWLSDIKAWGEIIAYFLKPGGEVYVRDGHPFASVFDNELDTMELKPALPYFTKGKPFRFEDEGSYIDEPNQPSVGVTVSYEWFHTLSDIVMSLINAGLNIEFLHEHPTSSWKAFAYAKEVENGEWEIDQNGVNIPLTFSILAKKGK